MDLFDTLLQIYIICAALCILLYLPRLSCWMWARRKQPRLKAEKTRTLALLIPARNESAAIGPLLESIQKQTYPQASFDTHVIVAAKDDPSCLAVLVCFVAFFANDTYSFINWQRMRRIQRELL